MYDFFLLFADSVCSPSADNGVDLVEQGIIAFGGIERQQQAGLDGGRIERTQGGMATEDGRRQAFCVANDKRGQYQGAAQAGFVVVGTAFNAGEAAAQTTHFVGQQIAGVGIGGRIEQQGAGRLV